MSGVELLLELVPFLLLLGILGLFVVLMRREQR